MKPMNLKPIHILMIALLSLGTILTGCKKYPDGGLVSKSDKRISAHVWKLDKYHRNGNDETSELLISNFTEEFKEDGTIIRKYTDPNGDPKNESGTWAFEKENTEIAITGLGSIELTDQTSTVTSSRYEIIRLKKDEFWYSYENGGDLHEFRMIPK